MLGGGWQCCLPLEQLQRRMVARGGSEGLKLPELAQQSCRGRCLLLLLGRWLSQAQLLLLAVDLDLQGRLGGEGARRGCQGAGVDAAGAGALQQRRLLGPKPPLLVCLRSCC